MNYTFCILVSVKGEELYCLNSCSHYLDLCLLTPTRNLQSINLVGKKLDKFMTVV